jgi:hypothetical protein
LDVRPAFLPMNGMNVQAFFLLISCCPEANMMASANIASRYLETNILLAAEEIQATHWRVRVITTNDCANDCLENMPYGVRIGDIPTGLFHRVD